MAKKSKIDMDFALPTIEPFDSSDTVNDDVVLDPRTKIDENETVEMVPLDRISSFANHPFLVEDDEEMEELTETIREHGIATPVILRKTGIRKYECISGHRRIHIAKKLGYDKVPAIIRSLDDKDAFDLMVATNKYRKRIRPSELAKIFSMKLAMMRHQGKSDSEYSGDSKEAIGSDFGIKRTQVHYYIRLLKLTSELLQHVDNGSLTLMNGVEISGYCLEMQQAINEYLNNGYKLRPTDLSILAKHKDNKKMSWEDINNLLHEVKPKKRKISFTEKKLKQYFPEHYTEKEIEKVLITLLEKWKEENNPQ